MHPLSSLLFLLPADNHIFLVLSHSRTLNLQRRKCNGWVCAELPFVEAPFCVSCYLSLLLITD
jgi:hypothetical protein